MVPPDIDPVPRLELMWTRWRCISYTGCNLGQTSLNTEAAAFKEVSMNERH